jgi:hypothetical protein
MPAIILAIIGFLGKIIASETARIIALKVILYAFFSVVLPIVLVNVFYEVVDSFLTESLASSGGFTSSSRTFSLTGLAGFFASALRLPEIFTVLMGALACKISLRMIPFVKVVN